VSAIGALAISLLLFVCALTLHVLTWRLGPPRRYLLWFLKYWAVLPLALVALYVAVADRAEIVT